MIDIKKLNTEQVNPNTVNIDRCNIQQMLGLINLEDQKVATEITKHISQIAKVVELTSHAYNNRGRIIYIGAGTSGRIGVLDAVECPPTFGVDSDLFHGLIAGGEDAFIKAKEGAEDSKQDAIDDLNQIGVNPNDIVIGIAASGRTPYVIAGLEYCKIKQIKTASIANVSNADISKYADIAIEVITGPESICGSTRMKAGTSQKLILNMISTATMINVGKVYKNYMVDLKITNKKLEQRAINMIIDICSINEQKAVEILEQSNWNVKTAILMLSNNIEYNQAISLLQTGKLCEYIKQ